MTLKRFKCSRNISLFLKLTNESLFVPSKEGFGPPLCWKPLLFGVLATLITLSSVD